MFANKYDLKSRWTRVKIAYMNIIRETFGRQMNVGAVGSDIAAVGRLEFSFATLLSPKNRNLQHLHQNLIKKLLNWENEWYVYLNNIF